MMEAEISKLSSVPWAAALIMDQRWTPITSFNRGSKPTGEDSFFATTLDTDRTIRSMLTLRPTKEEDDDMLYKELLIIVDLGDGLNGYPQVLHGGFAATLLDETCGSLIQLNMLERVRRFGSQHSMNYLTACKWITRKDFVSLEADGSPEI
jgi:thioesterase superfamily protein 4